MFKPTQEQEYIVKAAGFRKNLAIAAFAGAAKCLGKGTLVTMVDGTLRKVEDIKIGDEVLGVDGTHRTVLNINTGTEELFKVKQTKGTEFICNKSHILSVKMSIGKNARYKYKDSFLHKGDVVNLSVEEYLQQSASFQKDSKCYTPSCMTLNSKSNYFEPYFVGLWLGDGSADRCSISKPDVEIASYLEKLATKLNLSFKVYNYENKCPTYCLGSSDSKGTENLGNSLLRTLGILGNKHIPRDYKFASVQDRLALVAGLLDSDGSLEKNYFTWSSANKTLAADMAFVCRTLGFKVVLKEFKVTNYPENTYYKLSITGEGLETIPTIIPRKQASPRQQIKDANVSGFTIESIGVGEYYGFTLDGDSLFLLEDFTVTHNTTTCKLIANEVARPSLYIAFNKSIAEEAAGSFPIHVDCRTMHSLAYKAIVTPRKMFKKVSFGIEAKEVIKAFSDMLAHLRDTQVIEAVYTVIDCITKFCQSSSYDLEAFCMEFYSEEFESEVIEGFYLPLTVKLWNKLTDSKDELRISHDVYLKMFHLTKPKLDYEVIYLDECQDSNPVTLDIFLNQDAQLIMVGDPYQSIYEWRGASNAFSYIPDSFEKLQLTQSFRFTSEIAGFATTLTNVAGNKYPIIGLGREDNVRSYGIICRTNYSVINYLLTAARLHEKVYLLADLTDLWSKMYHLQALRAGVKPKYPNKVLRSYATLKEIVDEAEHNNELKRLLNVFTVLSVGKGVHANIVELKSVIVEKVSEADYTLTTIHKSKGLEWDRVTIDDDILDIEGKSNEEIVKALQESQTLNLMYVAVTRAKFRVDLPQSIRYILENSFSLARLW